MSLLVIRGLLEGRLLTWASTRSPALEIAWQNVAIRPAGETYLRPFVLPAPTTSTDLSGSHRSFTGIFQVSIVTPVGAGAGFSEGIAAELGALYPNALRLTGSGLVVMIASPVSEGPGIQDGNSYTLPAYFRFRAETI